MILFFKNIPNNTQDNEIATFVQPVIKGGLLGARGRITRIDVIALKEMTSNLVEFHALVNVEPEKFALKVIKILNGQIFKGQPITVQKYYVRNRGNDKRSGTSHRIGQLPEKRVNPQRRRKLEFIDKYLQ
jgi:hypothetical protein